MGQLAPGVGVGMLLRTWAVVVACGLAPAWAQAPPPGAAGEASATRRALRWAALGAGVALAGAGAAALAVGLSDEASIRDAARDPQGRIRGLTQREAAALEGDITVNKTLGVVGLSVGLAALIVGAALWATEPSGSPAAPGDPGPKPAPVEPFGWLVPIAPAAPGLGLGLGVSLDF